MDDKSREVYIKLLKMLVARDTKGEVVKEEWNDLLEWYTTFKERKKCPVLADGNFYWTKDISTKDRLWLTLRECLLSHRWKEALGTLIVIADTPIYASTYTIPRVGMELIYQLGMSFEMFERLIASSKITNSGLSKKEINIDSFLFSLATKFSAGLNISNMSLQMFAELTNQLKQRLIRAQNLRNYNSPSEQLNNILYNNMYNGLAAYAKWLLTKMELEAIHGSDDEEKEKLIEILTVQFKEATEHISRGAEEEGDWSSFIGKVVQMIEYQAVVEENKELVLRAEVVLSIYQKRHQRDLSTKKMLHSLYQRHRDIFSTEKRTVVLREIVALCPSDPLTLNLARMEKKDHRKIKLLFSFLNYHKDHHKAWMTLIPILQDNLNDETNKQTITTTLQALVSQREIHRSMFFFNPHWTQPTDLVILKASVACLLLGRKCALYKAVRKLIHQSPEQPSLYNLFKSVKHSSYHLEL